jgi:hypothetical protein
VTRPLAPTALLAGLGCLALACSSTIDRHGGGDAAAVSADAADAAPADAAGADAAGDAAAADAAGDDAAPADAGVDAPVVGHPELYTQPVFEMDFDQGVNGRYRANGGAWEDFGSWDQAGANGGWDNLGVWVQTTTAVRTELVANALGAGRVLRTWIEAGDEWRSTATYPRTELTSEHTADMPWNSEWRLELRFYAEGDVHSVNDSIIGYQLHHNGNSGSPPFGLYLSNGALKFYLEETPSGPVYKYDLFALEADALVELVLELKFGYVADGAYVRMWANGVQYVDITDRNVGYPDLEATGGYWKYCSLYDWGNNVVGSRSVYCGPTFRLLRRP